MTDPATLFVGGVYIPDVLFGAFILALTGLFVGVMRDVLRAVFREPLQRTVGTLAVVYVVQLSYISAVGDWGQEFAFIALDGAAAAVVLFRPAGWAQAMIGLTYFLEMAMHAAKAVLSSVWLSALLGLGGGFDPMMYWWFLFAAGTLQLIIAAGWWLYVRNGNGRALRRAHKAALAPHRRGAER